MNPFSPENIAGIIIGAIGNLFWIVAGWRVQLWLEKNFKPYRRKPKRIEGAENIKRLFFLCTSNMMLIPGLIFYSKGFPAVQIALFAILIFNGWVLGAVFAKTCSAYEVLNQPHHAGKHTPLDEGNRKL